MLYIPGGKKYGSKAEKWANLHEILENTILINLNLIVKTYVHCKGYCFFASYDSKE